jgi:hypothetical protein
MDVPPTLRHWFVVHAAVAVAAALPLLVAPEWALHLLGWSCVDATASRLVGAAWLATGVQSFRLRGAGVDVIRAFLGLHVIGSLAAVFGLFAAIGQGAPSATWAFLSIFIVFTGVWTHHAIRFRQLERAPADDVTPDEPV